MDKIGKNAECLVFNKCNKKLQDELEKQRQEVKKKKTLEVEIIAIKNQITGLSWQELMNIKRKYKFSRCHKCEVWEIIYNEKADEVKKS